MENDFFDLSKIHVKLYHTFFGYYLYDIPKDTLVCITESLYLFIKNNFNEMYWSNEVQNEMVCLYEDGYLGENVVKKIHYDMSYLNKLRFDENAIILQLTQKCNLKCRYCAYEQNTTKFQRMESNICMSSEIAKQAIDFFYEHSIKSNEIDICFYGGEPLLKFELMRELVTYCENKFYNKKITFNVTTNCTLITDEMIDFMSNHRFSVTVSLDGPKNIHNKNRITKNNKGTFNDVESNLDKLIEKFEKSDSNVRINAVLDGNCDLNLFDKYMQKYLDKGVDISAVIVDKIFLPNYEDVDEKFVEQYDYRKFLGVLSVFNVEPEIKIPCSCNEFYGKLNRSFKSINTNKLEPISYPAGRCEIGSRRMFVDINGSILPCEAVSERNKAFRIGDIWNGFDIEKINNVVNEPSQRYKSCINCYGISKCNLCARYIVDINTVFGNENHNCRATLNKVDEYYKLLALYKELKQNKIVLSVDRDCIKSKDFLKYLWKKLNKFDSDTEINDDAILTEMICEEHHKYIVLVYYYIILKDLFGFQVNNDTLLQTEFNTINNIFGIIKGKN